MRRNLIVVSLLIAIILSSCASGDGNNKSENVSEERERNAIILLSLDMMNDMEDFAVSPEMLSSALSPSFTFYADYVPTYSNIEMQYLEKVTEIASDAIISYYPALQDKARELSNNAKAYIEGDNSLSLELEEECGEDLESIILEAFSNKESDLREAFSRPERTFMEIRTGYLNLGAVGKGEELPLPSSIDLFIAAHISASYFFEELGKSERVLKNTPVSAGSLYAVFWE